MNIDLNEIEQALVNVVRHMLGTGEVQEIAEVFAKAQQDLEHSTEWEIYMVKQCGAAEQGEGWVPFAADSDSDVYWRRPIPKEHQDAK